MHFESFTLIVWITLWIVNIYSEFQVISSVITEILQNVKVFAPEQRQQRPKDYSYTTFFLLKQLS